MVARELTVTELVARCTSRPVDDAAWTEFVRRYGAVIKTSVLATYHRRAKQELERKQQFPESLVEDLVQAVYMKLVEEESRPLKQFSGSSENSFCAYLAMISVNIVRDHFREAKAQKRPKIAFSLDQLLDEQRDAPLLKDATSRLDGRPASRIGGELTIGEVDGALRLVLTGQNRDRDLLIFKLRYYEGLTLDEIREVLHLDLSTVSVGSVLNRTAAKLKTVLQRKRGIS